MLKAKNTIYFPYGPTETVHFRVCILHHEQWVATFPLHEGLGLKHLEQYWKKDSKSFFQSLTLDVTNVTNASRPLPSISTYCMWSKTEQ